MRGGFVRSTRLRFAVATSALTFVLAIAFGAVGAVSNAQVFGASTSLTVLSGDVLVRHGTEDFSFGVDGQVLHEGDTVRTGTDARAVLTYFEGSTVTIEPDSQLTIENSATLADGSTVVVMSQAFGRTWHVVTKLITGSSKYDVKTPASTASVRGTEFEVSSDDAATTVSTTEGTVMQNVVDPVDGHRVNVPVTAGATHTQPKNEPASPSHKQAEPERKVTITVGAANSLVVDPLGRTNGVTKEGKLVVQTPGAQVKRVDGKIVITLPNLPDGKLATRIEKLNEDDDADADVEATLEERGSAPVDLKESAHSDGAAKLAGFEFTRANGRTSGRALSDDEREALPTPHASKPAQNIG